MPHLRWYLWGYICREYSDNFTNVFVYAWQTVWLSGGDMARLHQCSRRMGKANLVL